MYGTIYNIISDFIESLEADTKLCSICKNWNGERGPKRRLSITTVNETFKIDEADDFHQVEGINITKYKAIDGNKETGGEIVWDNTNNKPVTDPKARGTFNRGINNNIITHGVINIGYKNLT